MSIELKVPTLGESISEATVSKWLKQIGEPFEEDDPLVEIETDKITVEVPAPSAGVLSKIKVEEGNDVNIGGVLAIIENNPVKSESVQEKKIEKKEDLQKNKPNEDQNNDKKLSPSVKKIIKENN